MHNPYNERFLKALDYLQERGTIASLREISEALDFHPNYIAGFRSGARNVQPAHLSKLFTKYRVSLHYLLIGQEPIMEKDKPAPEQKPEDVTNPAPESTILEKELALTQAIVELQQKIIAEKDAEIEFLRKLLLNKEEK